MLLRNDDCELNLPERAFGDSAMEEMKQAMLRHELIFRNQVQELHRLYWTQKNLMDKLRRRAVDDHVPSCSSWVGMSECKEFLDEKNGLSISSRSLAGEVANSLAYNFADLEEIEGKSPEDIKINSSMLNLNLPADRFIKVDGKDLTYSHLGKENSKGDGAVGVSERGKLASDLSLEKDPRSSSCVFRCQEVIDLEVSIELHCHEEPNNEACVASFHKITGPGDCCDAVVSGKNDVKTLLIDLNAPHEDEHSPDLNDPLEIHSSILNTSACHVGAKCCGNITEGSSDRKEAGFNYLFRARPPPWFNEFLRLF